MGKMLRVLSGGHYNAFQSDHSLKDTLFCASIWCLLASLNEKIYVSVWFSMFFLCASFFTIYNNINNYLKKSPLYLTLYYYYVECVHIFICIYMFLCFFVNWALCAFFVCVYSCLCMFMYVFLYVCLWNYSKTYRPV